MRLLDLPCELLDQIINDTLPEGFEAFALTCKAVYSRTRSQTLRHHNLKSRWSHSNVVSIFPVLEEFARDPLAASYIKVLQFEGMVAGYHEDIMENPEAVKRLRDMVAESKCLQAVHIDGETLWEILSVENEEWMASNIPVPCWSIAFFLSLLPNLRTLKLPASWPPIPLRYDANQPLPRWAHRLPPGTDPTRAWEVFMDLIIDRAITQPYREPGLAKLKNIVPLAEPGYDIRVGLQSLEYFLRVPEMRSLLMVSGVAVDDGYTGIPFQWRNSPGGIFLTRIELAYCCIDAGGISELLFPVVDLRIFKYSHQTKWHGCQHDWNAGAFIESVARQCGNTIIELGITVDDLHGDIINGAASFFFFPRLRILEMDCLIFRGPAIESGQRRGLDPYVPPGEKPWTEEDIPCIGGMVTTSIEEIHLNTDFPEVDHRCLNALLKNIREQRLTRLHNLRTFVLRQVNGEEAKPLAERAGVDFEVYITPGPHTEFEATMAPAWKREFVAQVGELLR